MERKSANGAPYPSPGWSPGKPQQLQTRAEGPAYQVADGRPLPWLYPAPSGL